METSKKGIELIKEFEGLRTKAYRCSANRLTIGYGHVIKEEEEHLRGKVVTISQKEAEELLKEDIKKFEEYLNKVIKENKIEVNQNQYDALISFLYNTGLFKEAMLARLKENKLKEVGEAMLLYNKAEGKELSGLTRRRQIEYDLFCR